MGFFGIQYLTAIGEDNKYIVSVSCGAAINLILNIILIPSLYSYGAAIATVIAEFIIYLLLMYFSRKIINIKVYIKCFIKYLIGALLMFIISKCVNINQPVWNIIIRIVVSIIVYGLYLIIIKDELLVELKALKNKFKKRCENEN